MSMRSCTRVPVGVHPSMYVHVQLCHCKLGNISKVKVHAAVDRAVLKLSFNGEVAAGPLG